MYNKLAQSQSTIVSVRDTRHVYYNSRDEQTLLKNPFSQNLPMKFPKNTIRKQTSQTMLTQTMLIYFNTAKIHKHTACEFTSMPIAVDFSMMCHYLSHKPKNFPDILSFSLILTIKGNCLTLDCSHILADNQHSSQ